MFPFLEVKCPYCGIVNPHLGITLLGELQCYCIGCRNSFGVDENSIVKMLLINNVYKQPIVELKKDRVYTEVTSVCQFCGVNEAELRVDVVKNIRHNDICITNFGGVCFECLDKELEKE